MPDSAIHRFGRWLGVYSEPEWDIEGENEELTTEVFSDEPEYEHSTVTSLDERRSGSNSAAASSSSGAHSQQVARSSQPAAPAPRPAPAPAPTPAAVEPQRVVTVHPRTYNEARTIGEHFRDGVPVIMNLSGMEPADAKRLVDFAAGLIFGLNGTIERVTSNVFLLSPANVKVSVEDKQRIAADSFYNQS